MYNTYNKLNIIYLGDSASVVVKEIKKRRKIMYLVSYTSVTSYDMDITSDLFSLC